MFEYFIAHARTDRYIIICSIVARDKKQPAFEDDGISIVDRIIPKHVTTESLEALGANFNFIGIWIKLLDKKYGARRVAYSTAMK